MAKKRNNADYSLSRMSRPGLAQSPRHTPDDASLVGGGGNGFAEGTGRSVLSVSHSFTRTCFSAAGVGGGRKTNGALPRGEGNGSHRVQLTICRLVKFFSPSLFVCFPHQRPLGTPSTKNQGVSSMWGDSGGDSDESYDPPPKKTMAPVVYEAPPPQI